MKVVDKWRNRRQVGGCMYNEQNIHISNSLVLVIPMSIMETII